MAFGFLAPLAFGAGASLLGKALGGGKKKDDDKKNPWLDKQVRGAYDQTKGFAGDSRNRYTGAADRAEEFASTPYARGERGYDSAKPEYNPYVTPDGPNVGPRGDGGPAPKGGIGDYGYDATKWAQRPDEGSSPWDQGKWGGANDYLSKLGGYDPWAAFQNAATGASGAMNERLSTGLTKLNQGAVGRNRLNTGFFETDTGEFGRQLGEDTRNSILSRAMEAAGIQADVYGRAAGEETQRGEAGARYGNMAADRRADLFSKDRAFSADLATGERDRSQDQYWKKRGYEDDLYDTDRQFGETAYQDRRDFGYKQHGDERDFQAGRYDKDRAFDEDAYRYDENTDRDAYESDRDWMSSNARDRQRGYEFDQGNYLDWLSGMKGDQSRKDEAKASRGSFLGKAIGGIAGLAGSAISKGAGGWLDRKVFGNR